ncbi:MAG: 50S ribosomal protein L9 [Lachnospiraceae bacterium]|nr:50S ribosomal protein L9 [Lachnospiraceae bacterium]
MKVILLEDVKTLGKKGQTVEINDGYARNYVIPKKLGLEASAKNLNDLKLQKANDERIAQEILEQAQAFAEKIKETSVVVKMKVGEGGKTFGTISSKEIAKAAMDQHQMEIDKKKIQVAVPIKSLGVYETTVKLHPKVNAVLRVKVEEEK